MRSMIPRVGIRLHIDFFLIERRKGDESAAAFDTFC